MKLIHQLHKTVEISEHYVQDPNAQILLVTNSAVNRQYSNQLRHFIRRELGMTSNQWNLNIYGGYRRSDEVEEEENESIENVLSRFSGKAVIFINNHFDFFGLGQRCATELCSPRVFNQLIQHDTSCLILAAGGHKAHDKLLQQSAFSEPCRATTSELRDCGTVQCADKQNLSDSVVQDSAFGSSPRPRTYLVPHTSKWYRIGNRDLRAGARRLSKILSKKLPSHQLRVCSIAAGGQTRPTIFSDRDDGHIAVLKGCNQYASVFAVSANSLNDQQPSGIQLPQFTLLERYSIVACLPSSVRVSHLWLPPSASEHMAGVQPASWFAFADEACELSIALQIMSQLTAYLNAALLPRMAPYQSANGSPQATADNILTIQSPLLEKLIQHPEAKQSVGRGPPAPITRIFQHALALCRPQRKRQMSAALLPLRLRRSKLHTLLKSRMTALMAERGVPSPEISEFFAGAERIHSAWDRRRRDVASLVVQRAARLTQTSEQGFRQALRPAFDTVSGAVCCDAAEWDRRYEDLEAAESRIEGDEDAARERLERQLLHAGAAERSLSRLSARSQSHRSMRSERSWRRFSPNLPQLPD